MKSIDLSLPRPKIQNNTSLILLMITAVTVLLSFWSCSKKIVFLSSSVVPAARGTIKITQDNNKNYVIKLDINNLAESTRLTPPKSTYIVWMESDKNVIKNIGQINSSTGFMSDKLTATFQAVSAMKPVRIFLTAEDDPSIQYPSYPVVFTTNNF